MKILLAVDMSECSRTAAVAVAAQFSPRGNEVKVLYAVEWERHLPSAYLFAEGPEAARAVLAVREKMLREGIDRVERLASPLREAGFVVTTETVPEGDPPTVILDTAAHWPADLIVVGSHGRHGVDRFLLGSVSERVVRHAMCSVEVVRPPRTGSAGPASS